MSEAKAREKYAKTQSNENIHAQQIGKQYAGGDEAEFGKTEYLRKLTDSALDAETVQVLDNLLSQDFVLANYKDAEVTETRWMMVETTMLRVEAMHPPQGSGMTGARRAFMMDDEAQSLNPLTDHEKQVIRSFLRGFFARVTRARTGWQQEQMSKTISVSEVRREDDDGSGGRLSGLFP